MSGEITPVFASPLDRPPSARRLLLLSYHFAPSTAAGAMRWQQMARFAVERGWGVDVVTLHPDHLALRDGERAASLPPDVRVFGFDPAPQPWDRRLVRAAVHALGEFRRGRAASRAPSGGPPVPPPTEAGAVARAGHQAPRGHRDVPREEALATSWHSSPRAAFDTLLSDQILRWDRATSRRAGRLAALVAAPEHRVVVASGPPHFMFEAARRVAGALGAPYVLDFRDPWSLNEAFPPAVGTRRFLRAVVKAEAAVVADAALIACNTELAAQAMRAHYPDAAPRILTVMNGSDEEVRPAVSRDPRFLIAYTGAVYTSRSPDTLFDAAARLVAGEGLTPEQFGIAFMGPVDGEPDHLQRLAATRGLAPFFRHHPPAPRREASRLLASASLLVSLPQGQETAIPSKIFEYATFDAWLLALARQGSASALLLAGSAADVVDPADVDGIHAVLAGRWREHVAGVVPRPVGADGRFSRRVQAERLLAAMERVTVG